jgi:hypothetical protein
MIPEGPPEPEIDNPAGEFYTKGLKFFRRT